MNTKTAKELIREYLTAEPKTSRISAGKFHHAVELVLSQLETCQLREDNKDHAITALRAERDELLDELKWAWDNLAKSEPYPDEECEYDRCTVCRCPDWKHSETCQLKEREAVARAILAKYAGKED